MMLRPFRVLPVLAATFGTFGVAAIAAPNAPGPVGSIVVSVVTAAPAPPPPPTAIPASTLAPAAATTAPASAPAYVLPQPVRGPYVGADGALHYPVDGPAEPQLACVPLFICDVTLESNESILNIATGDSSRWLIAAAQSGPGGNTPHVLIKPTSLGLRTNLIITTTRRVYYLRLSSASTTPYSRLSYFYPDDEAAAAAAAVEAAHLADLSRAAEQPLQPGTPLDTSYRMWGDSSFLPYRVYADPVHTFIEYAKLPTDLPVAFEVSSAGNDQIVNYRVKDTLFIIDGTPRQIDLVLNAGTGHAGNGERRVHIRHL
jgi:P-type conjugative transfer protein TrbG